MGCSLSSAGGATSPEPAPNVPAAVTQHGNGAAAGPVTGMVVDCGSGHASVLWYATVDTGVKQLRRSRLQVAASKTQFKLADELAAASAADLDERINRACWLLQSEMEAAEAEGLPLPSYLFIGATGGVREVLSSGAVQREAFDQFAAAVQKHFGHLERVRVLCLSGEQEAIWELKAARHIWGPIAEAMFGVEPQPDSSFGLFSGGGQSMQIAGIDASGGSLSWPFSTWCEAMDESRGVSPEAWKQPETWGEWEAQLGGLIATEKGRLGDAVPLSGCCVLTAMNEVAAKAAGFGEQPITADAATAACRHALAQFRAGTGEAFEEFLAKRKHYKYNVARVTAMHLCRLALVLEELCAPQMLLYAPDPRKHSDLHCEWALGAFITDASGRRLSASTVDAFRG